MSKLVAVTGATGQQGSGVVQALLAAGSVKVRAITRNTTSEKAQKLRDSGCDVVAADFDDISSITKAFEGADAAFLVTNYWEYMNADKEVQQGKNLGDACKAAGVKYVVWSGLESPQEEVGQKLTEAGLIQPDGKYLVPHFDAKAVVTKYLQELGLQVTTLWTSIYYENLTSMMPPVPDGQGGYSMYHNTGDEPLAWISVEDIGAAAAAIILQGPEAWPNKVVGIAGDSLTFAQIAEVIADVTGRKVAAVAVPDEAYISSLTQFMPELAARDLANMFAYYRVCPDMFNGRRDVAETKKLLPGLQSFKEWMTKHKDVMVAKLQ